MTPVYETPRLLVRRWTLDDLEAFHGLFGDKRMWRYLPSDPPASIDESLAMMQRMLARMQQWDGYGSFAAVRHADGLIIGNALLRPLETGPRSRWGITSPCRTGGTGMRPKSRVALSDMGSKISVSTRSMA
jgi:RimJ/RimL family protein N-acetyltransferase